MVYILFLALFVLASLADVLKTRKKEKKGALVFLLIILTLFVGLRYKTGADWSGYIKIFNDSPLPYKRHGYELGYVFLNKLIYYTFGNYYVLQFIATAFICIAVYFLIKNYSPFPLFSLCLFVIFFFNNILMAQVRQSLALAIIILSTKHILNRKFLLFVCYIVIASLFHVSAVCALPLYFLNRKINKFVLIVMVVVSCLFYYFPNVLSDIIKLFIPFMPKRLGTIATLYLAGSFFAQSAVFNTGFYFIANIALNVILICLIKPKNKETSFFLNATAMAVFIKNISTAIIIIDRLQAYYLIYGIIGYICFLSLINFKYFKEFIVLYSCLILVFFAIPYIRERTSDEIFQLTGRPIQEAWIPYYNVLSHPYEAQFRRDWSE
jgi:hypothetical protein